MPNNIAANLAASHKLTSKAAAADRGKAGTLKAKPNQKGTAK